MEKNIIHLDAFEGPLDLLLYLINKNEIDIYDIPIATITTQYMDHIYVMNELNIEVASEFIVMAATLLEIKSRMLLPNEELDEEDLLDPREDLVNRLIEYKAFKELSGHLKQKENIYNKMITRDFVYFDEIKNEITISEIDTDLLSKALKVVLSKHKIRKDEEKNLYEVNRETFSVNDRMIHILKLFENENYISLFSLFKENTQTGFIIATFLAVLELLKLEQVKLKQAKIYADVTLIKI